MLKPPAQLTSRGIVPIVASSFFWGSATTLSKLSLNDLSPLTLLTIQLAASCAFLWCAVLMQGLQRGIDRDGLRYALLGVLEPGLAYLFGLFGLTQVSASAASLIFAAEPILVFLLALAFFGQKFSTKQLTFALLAVLGVALTSLEGSASQESGISGVLLIFLGTLCASVYVICARNSTQRHEPLLIAALQQTTGLALVFFAWTVFGEPMKFQPSHGGVLLVLLVAGGTGIAQYALSLWCYLKSLKVLDACSATMFLSLIPVFGVATGALVLHESLSLLQRCGVLLTVLAVFLFGAAGKQISGRKLASPSSRDSNLASWTRQIFFQRPS